MADASTPRTEQDRVLAIAEHLATVAEGDTLYRDVYLRRAAELLSPVISEARWAAALTGGDEHARLLAQARAAVEREDWAQVRELGGRATALQRALDADKPLVAAAQAIYAAPAVVLDPLSPGLRSRRWASPAQARADVVAALGELARMDPASGAPYAARQRALEALSVPGATAPGAGSVEASAGSVQHQALQALERGDAAALQNLADRMLGRQAKPQSAAEDAARAAVAVPDALAEPIPTACVPRAKALGLDLVEATLASPAVAASVAEFVERYAAGASAATSERAREGVARVTVAAAEMKVPPEVAAVFAETISLFALHLFVNSAGIRYVPLPASREVLLVELHPDGDEAATPLLQELGLAARRGVARDDIEDRLRKNGARVVADLLGLDPLAYRIVCIPPDVFVRLGQERGWGQRPEWTHFDGYQVMQGGRLRALVGGNAKFGGLFDLCSIGRNDGRENVVVRFAVIRRERLGVRIG